MSSPGSGKTSLLAATIRALDGRLRIGVIEGDDKPAKYPVMFRAADLMLLSKTDLLPHLDEFSPERAEHSLRQLTCRAPVVRVSAKDGAGLADWIAWLLSERTAYLDRLSRGRTLSPGGSSARPAATQAGTEVTFRPVVTAGGG